MEKVLPRSASTCSAAGGRNERIGAALNFLDKLAPGAVTGVMSLIGEPAELEGRKAAERCRCAFRDGGAWGHQARRPI